MRQVLVAEDDRDTREVLVLILGEAGYAVSAAADVFTALAKTRTLHPDLVLLDYGLPGIRHGEEFLRTKAADPEIASIPVVVMSGYTLPPIIDGVVALIPKPFGVSALLAIVGQIAPIPRTVNGGAVA
jgi:CheY-like chemotaxis protein